MNTALKAEEAIRTTGCMLCVITLMLVMTSQVSESSFGSIYQTIFLALIFFSVVWCQYDQIQTVLFLLENPVVGIPNYPVAMSAPISHTSIYHHRALQHPTDAEFVTTFQPQTAQEAVGKPNPFSGARHPVQTTQDRWARYQEFRQRNSSIGSVPQKSTLKQNLDSQYEYQNKMVRTHREAMSASRFQGGFYKTSKERRMLQLGNMSASVVTR